MYLLVFFRHGYGTGRYMAQGQIVSTNQNHTEHIEHIDLTCKMCLEAALKCKRASLECMGSDVGENCKQFIAIYSKL